MLGQRVDDVDADVDAGRVVQPAVKRSAVRPQHFADLAERAVDLLLEQTEPGQLEPAVDPLLQQTDLDPDELFGQEGLPFQFGIFVSQRLFAPPQFLDAALPLQLAHQLFQALPALALPT